MTLAFAQVDERCAVTTVDQQAGERRGPEPLRTLATYRRLDGAGVAFGVYAAVGRPGHAAARRPGRPGPEVVVPPDNGGLPAPAATLVLPRPEEDHHDQHPPQDAHRSSRRSPLTAALVAGTAPAALAGGDDTVRRGSCSGSTDWKIKVGPEDGRLEVEAEVDSNRSGQTWRWRLLHDGSLSASGTRTTGGRQRLLRGAPRHGRLPRHRRVHVPGPQRAHR